jgi:hypothetical protein
MTGQRRECGKHGESQRYLGQDYDGALRGGTDYRMDVFDDWQIGRKQCKKLPSFRVLPPVPVIPSFNDAVYA